MSTSILAYLLFLTLSSIQAELSCFLFNRASVFDQWSSSSLIRWLCLDLHLRGCGVFMSSLDETSSLNICDHTLRGHSWLSTVFLLWMGMLIRLKFFVGLPLMSRITSLTFLMKTQRLQGLHDHHFLWNFYSTVIYCSWGSSSRGEMSASSHMSIRSCGIDATES